MRIAVNTRLLLPNRLEGIGWFAYETLRRISQDHPEHEFIFIFDRKPAREFIFGDNVKALVAHPQARHPILWYLFFEFGIYRILRKYQPDLFLSPDGWISLRSKVKTLTVIHDLNFEAHPEFLPRHIVWYYRYFFPRFAAKATRIATVSEFTKQDISTRYHIPLSRIDVVYNGANEAFKPLTGVEIAAVRERYANGHPYFLFVGLIHPRKNLENQLRAFDLFKTQQPSAIKFLVVGAKHWWSDGLDDVVKNATHRDDIIFLGRRDMPTLISLYGAAHALSYVSHFEGFGIPILEAMHAEIPMITSTTSSMPEVCGNAGLAVNPNSVEEIAKAMILLTTDQSLRNLLIANGRIQRKAFSWSLSAKALWLSIEKTLNQPE